MVLLFKLNVEFEISTPQSRDKWKSTGSRYDVTCVLRRVYYVLAISTKYYSARTSVS